MCVLNSIKTNPKIKFNNIRIVYFGINDIFQKSNIKDDILLDYKNKFMSSFQFVS